MRKGRSPRTATCRAPTLSCSASTSASTQSSAALTRPPTGGASPKRSGPSSADHLRLRSARPRLVGSKRSKPVGRCWRRCDRRPTTRRGCGARSRRPRGPAARDFKATLMPDCEVLTDPSTASYALLGARRGAWAVWSPRSWPAGLRAIRGGFRQTRTQGHAYLLGGLAILDSRGAVRWTYVSRYAGDHPHTAQVLAAVNQAVRGAGRLK